MGGTEDRYFEPQRHEAHKGNAETTQYRTEVHKLSRVFGMSYQTGGEKGLRHRREGWEKRLNTKARRHKGGEKA
jgi:hypothetical protein